MALLVIPVLAGIIPNSKIYNERDLMKKTSPVYPGDPVYVTTSVRPVNFWDFIRDPKREFVGNE